MAINKNHFILTIFIFFFLLLVNEIESFFVWLSFYFIGTKITKLVTIFDKKLAIKYFMIFYDIFSILGLIIFIDNYFNFNALNGFAKDDLKFFNGSMYLLGKRSQIDMELSAFSYFSAIIFYPISFLKQLTLVDFTIVNWMIAGLIAVVLNNISNILINKNIPIFLLILSYPLFFVFTDTFTRYYRDALLTIFFLISIQLLFQNKKIKSILFFLPIATLRLGTILYFGIFYFFKLFNITSLKKTILISVFLILISSITLPTIIRYAMIYGSDVSRAERYKREFSKLSDDQIIAFRFGENSATKNKFMANAYSTSGFKSLIVRWAFSFFYPLTFQNPNSSMNHYSSDTKKNGFYIYYIINWLNTFALIISFPLMLIGILKTDDKRVIFLFSVSVVYLIILLLVSGQMRHNIPVYIFNSIFLTSGYYHIKDNKGLKAVFYLSAFVMLSLVVVYNLFRLW